MTDVVGYRLDETLDRFHRSVSGFTQRVQAIRPDQWDAATPCTEWDVRALVNHVYGEQRWMAVMIDGRTMEQVGSSLDGDLLGPDPLCDWQSAVGETASRLERPGVLEQVVHLSSGPSTVGRYCDEVAADTLVHTWDLARAIGAEESLPADLVEHATSIVEPWVTPNGVPGVLAAPVPVPDDADAQTALLAMLGRDAR
jgi:uncharacterized protein (TIGR03086 family)